MVARNSTNVIQVVSPTDAQLLAALEKCLAVEHVVGATIHSSAYKYEEVLSPQELTEFTKSFGKKTGRLIHRMIIKVAHNASVTFDRGITDPSGKGIVASAYEAEFHFHVHQGNGDVHSAFDELTWIIRDQFSKTAGIFGQGSEPANAALGAHVQELAALSSTITENLAEAHLQYDERLAQHQDALRKDAEEAEKLRQEQFEARLQDFKKQEEALDEKRSELDLRRARDARRKLREQISANLKDRISKPISSDGAKFYRSSITGTVFVAVLLAVVSAGSALLDISSLTAANVDIDALVNPLTLAYGRFFGSSALAAVLVFYLLGYFKRLEAEDSRYERELERFALDIDRASWIAETVIEFRDDEDGMEVPSAWIDGVTNNLFNSEGAANSPEENALDALGELLKAGTKVSVGTNGASLELDSNASKKVAKSSN